MSTTPTAAAATNTVLNTNNIQTIWDMGGASSGNESDALYGEDKPTTDSLHDCISKTSSKFFSKEEDNDSDEDLSSTSLSSSNQYEDKINIPTTLRLSLNQIHCTFGTTLTYIIDLNTMTMTQQLQ